MYHYNYITEVLNPSYNIILQKNILKGRNLKQTIFSGFVLILVWWVLFLVSEQPFFIFKLIKNYCCSVIRYVDLLFILAFIFSSIASYSIGQMTS